MRDLFRDPQPSREMIDFVGIESRVIISLGTKLSAMNDDNLYWVDLLAFSPQLVEA